MGYRIIASLQQVEFTSKTRAGLNEEIDRFVKEMQPKYLEHKSGELVPDYSKGASGTATRQWRHVMEFE